MYVLCIAEPEPSFFFLSFFLSFFSFYPLLVSLHQGNKSFCHPWWWFRRDDIGRGSDKKEYCCLLHYILHYAILGVISDRLLALAIRLGDFGLCATRFDIIYHNDMGVLLLPTARSRGSPPTLHLWPERQVRQ
ncbi:hypothetical protein F5X96DRAFT_613735 [Biscogniauxia mediterranea]|nr:hypothetical protein F5X96DRAFT_613735 [Biscogniauxia mediterranea]